MKHTKIFLPTLAETVMLPLLSLLFFLIVNAPVIYSRFLSPEETTVASNYLYSLFNYLNNDVFNNAGLFLFWAIIGLISYSLITMITFTIHAYRSDIPTHEYSLFHPEANKKSDAIVRIMLRTAAAAMFVVLLLLSVGYVMSYLNTQFANGIISLKPLNLLLPPVTLAVDIFIGIFLVRLFLLKDRIVEE